MSIVSKRSPISATALLSSCTNGETVAPKRTKSIYTVEGTLRYTNILIVLVGVAVGRDL